MTRQETWRVQPGIQLAGLRIASVGAISIIAGVVANADPTHVVGLGLLSAFLAAVLVRGLRPSGLRRGSATWLVIALTVEAHLAVLGMATMVGIAIVLLLSAAPPVWRKFHGSQASAKQTSPHLQSSTWSEHGLGRPCLSE